MEERAGQELSDRGVTAHARRNPERRAIVCEGMSRTFGELHDRAARLATVLAEKGTGPGRPVATVLPNGIEQFEVATASAMLGAPYLPINWHLRTAELAFILSDADVAVVVGHHELADVAAAAVGSAGVTAQLVLVGDDYEHAIETARPLDEADSGPGPDLMFYTSGTTARPKGVVHDAMGEIAGRRAGLEAQVALWGWTPEDVYVMSGPAYHASHAGWASCALYVGATTIVTERFDARSFLHAVSRHRGTRSFMVPAHFIRILEIPDDEREAIDVSSLSLIVHAAAPCPVVVKRRMMDAFPSAEIHEFYGASEGGATKISPEEWRDHPGSVGRPWPGVEIRILDGSGHPVPTGEEGLVYIRPPGGRRFTYRNDEAATEGAWREDAFTVGDIGRLDDEGYLTITDRASDMVLWGGVNISPREIEEALYEHPAVVDCAVFGIPHERDGEQVKAMVQLRTMPDGRSVGAADLEAHLRSRLAAFKVPRAWEVVEELPRDQNGKVLKRLLRQEAAEVDPVGAGPS
ncbi:MAG: AMP-binding protein [Acidimicrobiales bacterium]